MHPPSASGEDVQRGMVVALGTDTAHWRLVKNSFPGIHNCCIDVARALRREWNEDTSGSGFDADTRTRIMAKRTWPVIWEVAMCVLREFGLLIILCNHGRHRSLTLAYELAAREKCCLVSMRDRDRPSKMLNPCSVLQIITPRVRWHLEAFARYPHPVAGIHVCRNDFDGTAWAANEHLDAAPHPVSAPRHGQGGHPGRESLPRRGANGVGVRDPRRDRWSSWPDRLVSSRICETTG